MGRKISVPVLLTSLEYQQVKAAADRVGIELGVYLRSAGLHAARGAANGARFSYTREQLMGIHRKARNRGHRWTEEELREKNLPLYWCEEWVRRRLAEGATRAELAVESGYPERSLTAYVRNVWGIAAFTKLSNSKKLHVRDLVQSGMPRGIVARELGLSETTVAAYARSLPGLEERKFKTIAALVGSWPATRMHIAQAAFAGDGPAASSWLMKKVRRGWLARVSRGVYTLTPTGRGVADGVAVTASGPALQPQE